MKQALVANQSPAPAGSTAAKVLILNLKRRFAVTGRSSQSINNHPAHRILSRKSTSHLPEAAATDRCHPEPSHRLGSNGTRAHLIAHGAKGPRCRFHRPGPNMSFSNGQPAWPSPALYPTTSNRSLQHLDDASARTSTPIDNSIVPVPEASLDTEEEARRAHFADLYRKTESRVALLFSSNGAYNRAAIEALRRQPVASLVTLPPTTDHEPIKEPPMKKAKRAIDEDNYDDDDDEDEDDTPAIAPKTQATIVANPLLSPSKSGSSPVQSVNSPAKALEKPKPQEGSQGKDSAEEHEIHDLDEARKATEDAARRSFHTIMYTLENDRTAMLEQQQLEDSEKQLQAEMDHNNPGGINGQQNANQGTLSSANLGASSLTLKHLIARIDMKRDQVRATDAELRVLMNEVRKNRSKWASEENVNQEELYEALEKVLTELKAHTEYSTPFLTRVNKRDAPDYYSRE